MLFEYSDLGTGDGVVIAINTFHRGGALSHFVIMSSLGWLLLGDSRGTWCLVSHVVEDQDHKSERP